MISYKDPSESKRKIVYPLETGNSRGKNKKPRKFRREASGVLIFLFLLNSKKTQNYAFEINYKINER